MIKNFYKNMGWMQISFILCMFGLLKEFRPSEPFVTDYFTGPWKNFTAEQVSQDIYPVGIYSYFATLVLVFLLTDFLRYKPVIILCGVSGTITFAIVLLATEIPVMRFMEFTYGLFLSTEVAYYTYIYAKVDKEHYQAVSSYTRGAYLVGKFLSGVVGQCFISYKIMDYHQLTYLTLLGVSLSMVWALFLPPVGESLYFHRSEKCEESEQIQATDETSSTQNIDIYLKVSEQTLQTDNPRSKWNFATKVKRAYVYLWQDFLRAYTNGHVVKWSLWWAFATGGYLQVISYIQLLWQTSVEKDAMIYNGGVEAAYTIIEKADCLDKLCILMSTGTLAVFTVGNLRLNWPVLGEGILSIFSILQAMILSFSSQSYNIWFQYGAYILFGVIYHTVITVASFEVAKNLADDTYGLVFGINTLLALSFQTLLTFILVSPTCFGLKIRPQFQVYAGYFLVLGGVFLLMAIYTAIRFFRSGQKFKLWLSKETATDVLERKKERTFV